MLTAEQIEMLRQGLLSSDWCGYSKRRTVNELCDMALSALRSHSAQSAASGEWVTVPRKLLVLWHRVMLQSNGEYEEKCANEMGGLLAVPVPEIPEARMGVHFDGEWNVTGVTIYDGGAGFKRYIPMVPEKQEEK